MDHIATQKITAHIPVQLLHDAQNITGKGITETLKEGLERLAREKSYANIRKLRGKVSFSIDVDKLREDEK